MEPACAIIITALLVMSNDGLVQTLEEAFATDTLMQKNGGVVCVVELEAGLCSLA